MYMCVPMSTKCYLQGSFFSSFFPSSSSSWHSLYFPLKLYLAIYSEEDGRDHQSWFHISKPIRSSPLLSLHHVLLPSSAVLKQEGRENPRRNPAPPAHQRPTGGKKEKNSGGLEEGGKSVGMCERECEKWVSGFPCLRMHVRIFKSFCAVYEHACAGSWVSAARGFDVLMRHDAHCRRSS